MEQEIILYSNDCPKCKILKKKLLDKGILFNEFNDVDAMINMGITFTPVLKIGDKSLQYLDAIKWVNKE